MHSLFFLARSFGSDFDVHVAACQRLGRGGGLRSRVLVSRRLLLGVVLFRFGLFLLDLLNPRIDRLDLRLIGLDRFFLFLAGHGFFLV